MAEALREIIFDTETTGLSHKDGDRVIEIGAVELVNRFPTGKTYHQFINPEGREVHPEALEIHGISNDFLKDKPTFREIFTEYEAFFSDGMLVAHNASFDVGFFDSEHRRMGKPLISQHRVVDTLAIAKRKFPGQRNSLDALCSRFKIDNSHREKHGALLDSELLAEVYVELMGGKQASLVLDAQEEAAGNTTNFGTANRHEPLPPRPTPLSPRISREQIVRHRQFIDTLGGDPVWNKYYK